MIVIAEILTNITSVGYDKHVTNKTQTKIDYTRHLMNICITISTDQQNESIENINRAKTLQLNKRPKKETNTNR